MARDSSSQHRRGPRKVKLLCSFGGRILPRPSDGALRYVGGHTRIISVPGDIPFDSLIAKMSEINGATAAAVLKYQLPDEDLDALISVSSDEDLENMMEEYEKLVESDPSAKIRAFLFSPENLGDSAAAAADLSDTGQRYFEAVNGIGASNESGSSSVESLKRKDSGLSAGSSNSEGFNEGTAVSPQNNLGFGDLFNNQGVNLAPLKPSENYSRIVQQPLSQLPPLPSTFQNAQNLQNVEAYGLRSDDCYMCQKMLPHAHSDPIAQNAGNVSPGMGNEASPVFYSQRADDVMMSQAPPLNLGNNVAEPKAESQLGAYGFPQMMENVDHSRVFVPSGSMGLSPDAQSSYELFFGNFPQAHYPVKPIGNDVGSVRNGEGSPEYANEYVRPNNGMMEGLHISPTPSSGFSGQGNAVVMPETSPSVIDGTYNFGYMPQVMLSNGQFANAGVVQERNYVRPTDQLSPTTSDGTYVHNFHAVEPGPFPHHLGVRVEPPMPSEGLLAMPTYTSGIDSTQLHSKDLLDQLVVPQSSNVPFGLSNAAATTSSPLGVGETFQEPLPTDSLFCNQDPRKILGGAHPLPPRPKRVASRESIVPKVSGMQIHLGNSTESDIIALLDEGGLHPSQNSLNKDMHFDHTHPMKGSGDEQIKQDLKAVAEGVASSVLNTSLAPAPVFFVHDTKEVNTEFKDERKIYEVNTDRKLEDNKPKAGVHVTDDIGRLQIIKNGDLEELRELGSGTFGTVYHGKWRGTDVAIKRINDRCFAGKPSEQEKMRADFWNEACKLADLHHPNVVAFYGVVLDGPGGSVATVTEYMVNGSLRNALQRNDKTLDRRKRLLIAMDVAFGMEYLHGKNIVHFDLKSDNLLVNLRDPQRPICKVGDLGLSKVKCQTLISGGVRGTLPWMAPELLNGSSSLVSEKVDVFSFGIVMWELLTGEEPYADLHYGAIIGGIVSNTLRPPVPDYCDPEWRALMERCWSADPSERPSFTEVAERLRSMAVSLPTKHQVQK